MSREYAATLSQPTLSFGVARAGALGRYDEVVAPDGTLRPAWRGLSSSTDGLTSAELQRIGGEIAEFLADDGVTYAHPEAGARPWQLDPVPLVVDAASWSRLEVGLAQRAELLNALLADLYGPQTLLSEGVIPAAVVVGHAGFVRAVAGHARDDQQLVLAGADLGRDADGTWRVLTDRVQAPSGLGYAIQNRRVLSRVLPKLSRDAGHHRVEPYLAALRSALVESACGAAGEDPRVVILSPGTHSETAFDQAFLATALGFPLVQGSDLVVRDGWVWLKPTGWPEAAPRERVDVILRRVDAEWCDPLELRGDSQLGIAGLVEAVRRGRVRVVNGLGAGVLENPGLLPYMPAICERLLGEPLRLPAVPTWWCGEPAGLREVLDRLAREPEELIVRALDGRASAMEALDPTEVVERILAAPHRYVGQQRLPLSQAPVWHSAGPEVGSATARPLVLRTFAVRYGSTYRPLVGGMALVVGADGNAVASKDVWVLKSAPEDPDQGLVDVAPLALARSTPALSPRALDDSYWAGRYAERAEDLLRLVLAVRADAERLAASPIGTGAGGSTLIDALQRLAGVRWQGADDELRSALLDLDRPGSVADALDRLRQSLEGVRDQLSSDVWRAFAITDRAAQRLRESPYADQIADAAGRMLTAVLSLHGVTASMIRDSGWHMIEAGRHLERAQQVVTMLSATTLDRRPVGLEQEVLAGVLVATESSVTHRRRYRGAVRLAGVLELLLLDGDNPRSLAFAVARLREHLAALPASTGSTRPERLVEDLADALAVLDPQALAAPAEHGRPLLERTLGDLDAQLRQLSDAIAALHFASGPLPQPISSLSLTELMEPAR